MENDKLLIMLTVIAKRLKELSLLRKRIYNFREMCWYLGIGESQGYKLTGSKEIPYSCPNGKKMYFERQKLDEWKLKNAVLSKEQIDREADNYLIKTGKRKI
jgi:excisionase family DNA binding protein